MEPGTLSVLGLRSIVSGKTHVGRSDDLVCVTLGSQEEDCLGD
jgi:hypothetical protein